MRRLVSFTLGARFFEVESATLAEEFDVGCLNILVVVTSGKPI